MKHSSTTPHQSGQTPWSVWSFALIGLMGGLALTTTEAIERTIVLTPFFANPKEQLFFLIYSSPTLLSTTLIGILMGAGFAMLRVFRQLDNQVPKPNLQYWRRWASHTIRLGLIGLGVVAGAFVLRPTFTAIGRRISTLAKEPMRKLSPEFFEPVKSTFQWIQTHPLIILAGLLIAAGAIGRWASRRAFLKRIHLSKKQGLILSPGIWLLMIGVYVLDSRYFFSIYDRSIHLPLFFIQLGLALTGGMLIYRAFNGLSPKRVKLFVSVGMVIAIGLTAIMFVRLNTDQSLKALFWSRSVLARRTITLLQWTADLDRDGFSSILGGGDPNNRDPQVNPLAREIPNNGVDENGLGGDLKIEKTENRKQKPETGNKKSGETERPAASDQRPATILLITIDALRADHLGCYGYTRPTSPHLDKFAQQGQMFLHAYSQGTNTGHSFASMVRSAYGENIFDDGQLTFIEVLTQHGYATAFFNAKRSEKWLRGRTWAQYKPTLFKGIQFHAHADGRGQWSADDITDALINYLKNALPREPRFIWAHYLEPHYPYRHYPDLNFGERRVDRYDSEIAHTDRALGRLFDYLDRSGAWKNTFAIISSDHGEAFFEHGQQEHSSRPYQEQIRIPLLMRHPTEPPGQVERPAGLIDLGPTILSFADLAVPSEYQGIDLFSPLPQAERQIFSETPRNIPEPSFYVWAMIDGPWKLMYDVVGHTFEIYYLPNDPGERSNLVDVNPTKAQELTTKFGRWFDLQSLYPVYSEDWSVRRLLRK